MNLATTLGKTVATAKLKERRDNQPEQIDNVQLPAGADLYFYCKSCGHLADQKPELYVTPVKKLCDECQAMQDLGWLE
jgi:hypothetical protein